MTKYNIFIQDHFQSKREWRIDHQILMELLATLKMQTLHWHTGNHRRRFGSWRYTAFVHYEKFEETKNIWFQIQYVLRVFSICPLRLAPSAVPHNLVPRLASATKLQQQLLLCLVDCFGLVSHRQGRNDCYLHGSLRC